MKLTGKDVPILVTSLNKLDNPRANELVKWILSGEFLTNQEKVQKWDLLENAKTHEALVRYAILEQENKQLREIIEKIQEIHYFDGRDCSKLILPFLSYENACLFSIKLEELLATKEKK